MRPNPQFPADLVTFTEETLIENHIFWVVTVSIANYFILLASALDFYSFLKEFHNHPHSHYGSFFNDFCQYFL